MPRSITSQNTSADAAVSARENLFRLFKSRPLPDKELLVNLGLFMRSGTLAKVLFINEVYEKITHIPGIVCEFGVWWGQTLALFENLRAVYEPYNHTRKVVGFDTFTGYPEIGENDRRSDIISENVYAVSEGYEKYLDELLSYHESENVMSHIKKHSLIKGDVNITAPQYFQDNPETIVALAFFDMALYKPTKVALEAIKPRLIKGSIVVFDELNHPDYPGETLAALEVLGVRNHKIHCSKYLPDRSYFIID